MKSVPASSLSLSLCGLLLLAHSASAQGPLVPPGPPGPMMKTLQEMEPRTHIAAAGYVITAPGSYYLTGNLNGGGTQNGISVQASGVTIDLRGFSIENCQVGISAGSGVRTVAVANGSVRDCNAAGVDLSAAALCRLEGVIVSANGGDGASVGAGSLVTLCTSSGNGGHGLLLGDNGTVFRCVVQNNANSGIVISSNCQVTENTCTANGNGTGQAGLVTTGANNRMEGNSANYNNGRGFLINGTNNLVIRNNACGNTLGDYLVIAGNNYGQILLSPGPGFVNSNAWANFGCSTQPGGCVVDSDCEDGNGCTADFCEAGVCSSNPIPGCGGPCVVAADCDDGNECTTDICQEGTCFHEMIAGCGAPVCGNGIIENGETCDDGNLNNGDGCSATCQIEGGGACITAADCDDGNSCTQDICVAGVCQYNPSADGTACNDGDACTTGDVCIAGTCTGGTPVSCDDGDPCTVDSCDSISGCISTPIPDCGGSCTDGIQNGSETGVDCGGGLCASCANGQGCNTNSDCASGICSFSVCVSN